MNSYAPTSRTLRTGQRGSTRGKGIALPTRRKKADTLVVYIFSNTDGEYANNLKFFLKHGVRVDDGCDYVVVIQTGNSSKVVGNRLQRCRRSCKCCCMSIGRQRIYATFLVLSTAQTVHVSVRLQGSVFAPFYYSTFMLQYQRPSKRDKDANPSLYAGTLN